MEIKNIEQAIEAIQKTSGLAGESNLVLMNINEFIEWYKKDISFCTERGKEIGEHVLTYLNKVKRYRTT